MSASLEEDRAERIARLIPPEVRALSAYAVADSSGLIKLDAMENPYTWPPELEDAWLERLRGVGVKHGTFCCDGLTTGLVRNVRF